MDILQDTWDCMINQNKTKIVMIMVFSAAKSGLGS